ncbi:MAG: OmpH family outer membrane protein [Candidatus Azobacteroides sp.]|nr:OmpH family outer membrane protein [Candidatus Azobacteroides sp.]
MKNINYLISGVLAVCIIILFILHFTSRTQEPNVKSGNKFSNDSLSGATLPIAYIRVDSLLANYNFSKEVSETLLKKYEDSRLKLNQRARQLQNDIEKFQQKIQNNAFLSRESAENKQKSLIRKQESLQQMEQDLTNDFAQEQQKLNEQLKDSINAFLTIYNESEKYQLILTGEVVLQGEDAYDITEDVINGLNLRYPGKKEE